MQWILEHPLILFDFDGLLVNTEHLHFKAYQQTLTGFGHSFPWDFNTFASAAHYNAQALKHMIQHHAPSLFKDISWNDFYQKKAATYQNLINHGTLSMMPGATSLLSLIQSHNIPHAVVTNSTYQQINTIRKSIQKNHEQQHRDSTHPLLNIPKWITREDYKNPKPSPDGYLHAQALFPSSKTRPVGFEDTLKGINSLKLANIIPVLICPHTHPQIEHIDTNTIQYYESLESLL